jgi:hypothetical protein
MSIAYDTETAPAPASLRDLAADEPAPERTAARMSATVTLESGETFTVAITHREFVAWDKTAAKHKWPAAADAPFMLNAFLAFAAATRAGLYAGSFAQFSESDAVDISLEQVEPARPTR